MPIGWKARVVTWKDRIVVTTRQYPLAPLELLIFTTTDTDKHSTTTKLFPRFLVSNEIRGWDGRKMMMEMNQSKFDGGQGERRNRDARHDSQSESIVHECRYDIKLV